MRIELEKFPYKYMEYEKILLERELQCCFTGAEIEINKNEIILNNVMENDLEKLQYLTYICSYSIAGETYNTLQAKLEYSSLKKVDLKRQGTRYSTHGLHEYKGKYNPQIVHGVLDILGVPLNAKVLDPFCGSGTTMVECAHYDMQSVGTDINPMAVFLSNTKVNSLKLEVQHIRTLVKQIAECVENKKTLMDEYDKNDLRMLYLSKWIPKDTLCLIERLKETFELEAKETSDFLKVTVSDLIRDYSNQEPSDLRIRKRTSPFPTIPFIQAWINNVYKYLDAIEGVQKIKSYDVKNNYAVLQDIRKGADFLGQEEFDVIMTSPPYATALPYIDTQRISLIWLGFCSPNEIMMLESSLIGSREFVSNEKKKWLDEFNLNMQELPPEIISLVKELYEGLSDKDGFRKQAVPILLYRYFTDMKRMFDNTYGVLKKKGKFALVVGNNKTTIGGKTHVIDTPYWLAKLSESSGWKVDELLPLQTYKRYGINSKNAINSETLIILQK